MPRPAIRSPIGISDFRELREGGFAYVDKTMLVDEVLAEAAKVLLVPRPRRFGKTLNLSMLRWYFDRRSDDASPLFEGLAIASSDRARAHFQRHPVIFLSFKDVKATSWEGCLAGVANVLSECYSRHRSLLADGRLDPEDARLFEAVLGRRATQPELVVALKLLSRLLARHHQERVVILIDEYDTPIHAGHGHGYYDEVVAFFRDFLSGGLKDNEHLFKGVLTGILRVARESLFSGLNNIEVYSILREQLATAFGFTEPEVRALTEAAGRPEALDGIRGFYNGYLFGGQAIYNPWSVLSFLNRDDGVFRPYWIETSSNDLVRELLLTGPSGVKVELEALLAGELLERRIDEHIVLRDIASRRDAVWSFLLFSGYLKAVGVRYEDGETFADLTVPNREVAGAFRTMVRVWFENEAGGMEPLQRLLDALLRGEAAVVERALGRMLRADASYFDTAAPEPERFYHGLVVGLLAGLQPRYDVRSNRESGFGRCDVMVLPKTPGQPGVVLELKRVALEDGESIEQAFAAAFEQIRERDYATELRERGATPIHEMVAVFDGKRAWVRVAGDA
ncbi:AAA family ATPase [Paraliomyxa miuraensis]|uniref:AAA family ATPase n=1 Tax=Paraliomyxa miuraensis TaxID=376150 RepID=UPI0022545CC3|nr:AAA family ATPase [Paraliomyxa miuraensis]MCX4239257.1 ATP-binding protein [Paraliomyxa miuraensis]